MKQWGISNVLMARLAEPEATLVRLRRSEKFFREEDRTKAPLWQWGPLETAWELM